MSDTTKSVVTEPVVIVGGGPAGALLALGLVRRGVPATVLERATDLDRSFRGNTLNPTALHLLEAEGVLAAVLARPHTLTTHFTAVDPRGTVRFADFRTVDDRFPHIVLVQQSDVLGALFEAASQHDGFRLITGAEVTGLIEDGETVRGVRFTHEGEAHEQAAPLVVGTDGRNSTVRRLAGLTPEPVGAPIDVLWFTLPRRDDDAEAAGAYFRFGPGGMFALMDAGTHWQVGAIITKGSFEALRSRGLDAFRADVAATAPDFADRVDAIASWNDLALLEVCLDRLGRWHRPGLLCLGDAAHAMSPVGMVGINLAMQDAAEAVARLAEPLRAGRLTEDDLAAVQRRREPAARWIQRAQALVHRRVLARGLHRGRIPQPERWLMGLSPARALASRLIARGLRPS